MALTTEDMRQLVWEALRRTERKHREAITIHYTLVNKIAEIAEEREIPLAVRGGGSQPSLDNSDDHTLRVVVHELLGVGVIVTGYSLSEASLPWIEITDYGFSCLDAGGIVPHDSKTYLSDLGAAVPDLDSIAERYLHESLECFRRGCLMSCTVMLGGAAEKTFILLVETLGKAIQDPAAKADFEKQAVNEWRLKSKFTRFQREMERVQKLPSFPKDLREDLDIKLNGIFSLIRRSRNDVGHPSGKTVSKEDAHGLLLLFPGYCKTAYELMEFFGKNQV